MVKSNIVIALKKEKEVVPCPRDVFELEVKIILALIFFIIVLSRILDSDLSVELLRELIQSNYQFL